MRWQRGPLQSGNISKIGVFDEKGQKWRLIAKIAKLSTKIQMRWERGPLESGDIGENGD